MPIARLTQVVDMTIYEDMQSEDQPELLAFTQSGVLVGGEEFDRKANADGELVLMDFWRDLDHNEEENFSDDSDDRAPVSSPKQSRSQAVKAHVNKAYGSKDLVQELQKGENIMRFIKRRFDRYWAIRLKKRIVASTIGMYNANVAGNFHPDMLVPGTANDMIVDITGQAGAANKFSRSAFTQCAFTLGDHYDLLNTIVVHSFIYQTMIDNEDIVYLQDSRGTFSIPTYMGKRVIVDDNGPKVTVAGNTHFISIMLGSAMFGFGNGTPTVPSEVERDGLSGNGGGEEHIIERKTWMIAGLGHSNLNATATVAPGTNGTKANQQSNTDLQNANNWQRTHSRQNVPIAFLVTRG